MTEAEGRTWLKNMCASRRTKVQRIESGSISIGIPDLFIRTEQKDCWMELKCVIIRPNAVIKIPFRPRQFEWLQDYHKLGGCAMLAVFFVQDWDACVAIFKGSNILKTYTAHQFNKYACLIDKQENITFEQLETAINA